MARFAALTAAPWSIYHRLVTAVGVFLLTGNMRKARMNAEESCCGLCGVPCTKVMGVGEDFEYGTMKGPFRFYMCDSCEHLFLGNRPERSFLDRIYPRTYYTLNPASPLYLRGLVYRRKLAMDLKRLRRAVDGRQVTRILDVGCGDCARLLNIARSGVFPGAHMTGLDLQFNDSVSVVAETAGIELLEGNIEKFTNAQTKFDLILMHQLIEHLYEPVAALENVGSLLRPGGIALIDTPHWPCLDFRLFKGKHWGGYHFPRHFNIFSAQSLRTTVERCGLRVVRHGFLPSPGFWIISLRNRLGLASGERSSSFGEWLNFSNVAVVTFFSLLDQTMILLGGKTSNQYVVAERL